MTVVQKVELSSGWVDIWQIIKVLQMRWENRIKGQVSNRLVSFWALEKVQGQAEVPNMTVTFSGCKWLLSICITAITQSQDEVKPRQQIEARRGGVSSQIYDLHTACKSTEARESSRFKTMLFQQLVQVSEQRSIPQ